MRSFGPRATAQERGTAHERAGAQDRWRAGDAGAGRSSDRPGAGRRSVPGAQPPAAVLLDRDGTLLVDVPYNGDPAAVEPLPGVPAALGELRAAGCRLAVVSNQSGIGRGRISRAQVAAVNRRMTELLGPFDAVLVCPHTETDGCGCRKPRPGLLTAALTRLRVPAARAVMVGDIGADVEAAAAIGVRAVLVPTAATRRAEIEAAPEVSEDLAGVVERLLGHHVPGALR